MKWTVPVPTTIRTLRAAAWQGHYLPKGGYTGLTHALPCRGRSDELQQNARPQSRFHFVKTFGAGRL